MNANELKSNGDNRKGRIGDLFTLEKKMVAVPMARNRKW
jgi:hypothetical protein